MSIDARDGSLLGRRGIAFSAVGRATRRYPGALFLSAGGYHHHLGLNTWAGPGGAPAGANDARLLDWEIVLPRPADADAAAGSLRAAGHPSDRIDGGWLAADPWGTNVRIVAAE